MNQDSNNFNQNTDNNNNMNNQSINSTAKQFQNNYNNIDMISSFSQISDNRLQQIDNNVCEISVQQQQVDPMLQYSGKNDRHNEPRQKSSKRKWIIIGCILGTIVIMAVLFLVLSHPSSNSTNSAEDSFNKNSVKITGSVSLVKQYDRDGYTIYLARGFENDPYFKYINDVEKWEQVIDMNGKVLFTVDRSTAFGGTIYIKDGYFKTGEIGDSKFYIHDINGKKNTFDTAYDLNMFYNNGILYYSFEKDGSKSQAYNLKTGKVLWEINGSNPFVLENGMIVLQESKHYHKNKIVDGKTGETLIESKNENEELYVTESCYYLVDDAKVDVYDYNNTKLSTYNLVNDENYKHSLTTVLSNGGYVIRIYNKKQYNSLEQYKVYNKNGEEILSFEGKNVNTDSLYYQPYGGGYVKKNTSTKYSFVNDNQNSYNPYTYIIYQDETIDKLYSISKIGDYIVGYVDKDCTQLKIINLKTKESKVLDEKLKNEFYTPKNNNYFIIHSNIYDNEYDYYVYNKDYKKVYSSNNTLSVVNDEYFLEIDQNDHQQSKIYLVNAKTLNKTLLETTGVYDFNTENNIVTYELNGNKQWLYKFK